MLVDGLRGESLGDDLEAHVAAGDGPLVVLLGKYGANQPDQPPRISA